MIRAPGFRLVIKPDDVVEKTASGIQLVFDKNMEKNATVKGKVIEVGPIAFQAFKPYVADWVKVGDYIGYPRYAGKWATDSDGTDYLVIDDADVVCIYE